MRVAAAAEEAGLQLRPRNVRVFDEVLDIVKFDLVIVLDHFDHTEVMQAVPPDYLTYVYLGPVPCPDSCKDALPQTGSLHSGNEKQNGI